MPTESALSPEVLSYLERINGAPSLFERFLTSGDFQKMQTLARDFGGITVTLPGGKYDIILNTFGVLTLTPQNAPMYSVHPSVGGVARVTSVMDFLSGIREWVYPEQDSAWCAETVIQAIYNATTARVEEALARNRRE